MGRNAAPRNNTNSPRWDKKIDGNFRYAGGWDPSSGDADLDLTKNQHPAFLSKDSHRASTQPPFVAAAAAQPTTPQQQFKQQVRAQLQQQTQQEAQQQEPISKPAPGQQKQQAVQDTRPRISSFSQFSLQSIGPAPGNSFADQQPRAPQQQLQNFQQPQQQPQNFQQPQHAIQDFQQPQQSQQELWQQFAAFKEFQQFYVQSSVTTLSQQQQQQQQQRSYYAQPAYANAADSFFSPPSAMHQTQQGTPPGLNPFNAIAPYLALLSAGQQQQRQNPFQDIGGYDQSGYLPHRDKPVQQQPSQPQPLQQDQVQQQQQHVQQQMYAQHQQAFKQSFYSVDSQKPPTQPDQQKEQQSRSFAQVSIASNTPYSIQNGSVAPVKPASPAPSTVSVAQAQVMPPPALDAPPRFPEPQQQQQQRTQSRYNFEAKEPARQSGNSTSPARNAAASSQKVEQAPSQDMRRNSNLNRSSSPARSLASTQKNFNDQQRRSKYGYQSDIDLRRSGNGGVYGIGSRGTGKSSFKKFVNDDVPKPVSRFKKQQSDESSFDAESESDGSVPSYDPIVEYGPPIVKEILDEPEPVGTWGVTSADDDVPVLSYQSSSDEVLIASKVSLPIPGARGKVKCEIAVPDGIKPWPKIYENDDPYVWARMVRLSLDLEEAWEIATLEVLQGL